MLMIEKKYIYELLKRNDNILSKLIIIHIHINSCFIYHYFVLEMYALLLIVVREVKIRSKNGNE